MCHSRVAWRRTPPCAYYERGMERERLSDGRGDLEFTRTTEIVLGRNLPCPCRSGKKFKKCCGFR
jgi:uncharacterized protein YecA (UPF0149 family)